MPTMNRTKQPTAKKTTVRIQGKAVTLEKSPVSGLYRKPSLVGEKPISRTALNRALDHAW